MLEYWGKNKLRMPSFGVLCSTFPPFSSPEKCSFHTPRVTDSHLDTYMNMNLFCKIQEFQPRTTQNNFWLRMLLWIAHGKAKSSCNEQTPNCTSLSSFWSYYEMHKQGLCRNPISRSWPYKDKLSKQLRICQNNNLYISQKHTYVSNLLTDINHKYTSFIPVQCSHLH